VFEEQLLGELYIAQKAGKQGTIGKQLAEIVFNGDT